MTRCPHDPTVYAGKPVGMYHCPECGEMVVAGMAHPDYDTLLGEEDWAIIDGLASRYPREESGDDEETIEW